jgi:transposase
VRDQGLPPRLVAERVAVGLTTVKRYARLAAADALAPRPRPGRSRARRIRPEHEAASEAHLAAHDDATLAQHCRLWHEAQGGAVSEATMSRAIKRLGWTQK